jgi:hypothetical protein
VWFIAIAPNRAFIACTVTSVLRGRAGEAARLLGILYAEVVVRFFCPPVFPIKVDGLTVIRVEARRANAAFGR